MEWEVLREKSKRWNPEVQYSENCPGRSEQKVDLAPDDNRKYCCDCVIGTRHLTKHL